jgi:hypothetical protein
VIVPGHDPSRDRDNPSNGFVPSVPSWDEAYVPNVPSLSRDISRVVPRNLSAVSRQKMVYTNIHFTRVGVTFTCWSRAPARRRARHD